MKLTPWRSEKGYLQKAENTVFSEESIERRVVNMVF